MSHFISISNMAVYCDTKETRATFMIRHPFRKLHLDYNMSPPPLPSFSGAKFFFHVKSENTKFLLANNMRDFSLFIE